MVYVVDEDCRGLFRTVLHEGEDFGVGLGCSCARTEELVWVIRVWNGQVEVRICRRKSCIQSCGYNGGA